MLRLRSSVLDIFILQLLRYALGLVGVDLVLLFVLLIYDSFRLIGLVPIGGSRWSLLSEWALAGLGGLLLDEQGWTCG